MKKKTITLNYKYYTDAYAAMQLKMQEYRQATGR
jgi:hypothetical protein